MWRQIARSWSISASILRSRRRRRASVGIVGFGTEFGGQEDFDMNVLTELRRRTDLFHDPVYLVPSDSSPLRRSEIAARDVRANFFDDEDHLAQILARSQFDVVSVALHDPIATLRALRATGTSRRIVTIPNLFMRPDSSELCDAAHVVVFPSQFARRHGRAAGCRAGRAAAIVLPPVALDHYDDDDENDLLSTKTPSFAKTFTVAYVGRIVPEKSVGTVVRAAAALRAREGSPFVRFLFVGDGTLLNDLRHLAESLDVGTPPLAEFRGAATHAEVLRVLETEVDAIINPSFGETFGIVIVEAMSRGVLPIVRSCSGGPREIVDMSGTTLGAVADCEGGDAALVDAVLRLATMPSEERRRLSDRARRYALDTYSRNEFGRRYAVLYEIVAGLPSLSE